MTCAVQESNKPKIRMANAANSQVRNGLIFGHLTLGISVFVPCSIFLLQHHSLSLAAPGTVVLQYLTCSYPVVSNASHVSQSTNNPFDTFKYAQQRGQIHGKHASSSGKLTNLMASIMRRGPSPPFVSVSPPPDVAAHHFYCSPCDIRPGCDALGNL